MTTMYVADGRPGASLPRGGSGRPGLGHGILGQTRGACCGALGGRGPGREGRQASEQRARHCTRPAQGLVSHVLRDQGSLCCTRGLSAWGN